MALSLVKQLLHEEFCYGSPMGNLQGHPSMCFLLDRLTSNLQHRKGRFLSFPYNFIQNSVQSSQHVPCYLKHLTEKLDAVSHQRTYLLVGE